jgi:hypothetical protein
VSADLLARLAEWHRIARAATGPGRWLVCRSKDIGKNWLIGVGRDDDTGEHYGVTTDGVHASELCMGTPKDDATHIATWSPDRALLVVEALRAAHNYCKLEARDFQVRGELFRDLCNALAALDSPPPQERGGQK